MWLSPKWFCFLFIYFVLYHGPEASKVQIKLTYLLTYLLYLLMYKFSDDLVHADLLKGVDFIKITPFHFMLFL